MVCEVLENKKNVSYCRIWTFDLYNICVRARVKEMGGGIGEHSPYNFTWPASSSLDDDGCRLSHTFISRNVSASLLSPHQRHLARQSPKKEKKFCRPECGTIDIRLRACSRRDTLIEFPRLIPRSFAQGNRHQCYVRSGRELCW